MRIAATLAAAAAAALAAGLVACGGSAARPGMHQPAAPASSRAATQQALARASAKTSAAAKHSAAQTAAMNRWCRGTTVVQAANVCGDVYQVYFDNVKVNSGSGSSSLEGDITKLQTDVATALSNPPPVAADARIWKRVLNAYSTAAGGPPNSGLVAAVRSAKNAAWTWTPSVGGTLLVCLNVSI